MAAESGNGDGLGRPREWSPERVREELERVANGSGEMPSMRELNAIGRADLRHAIVATGGVEHWAYELGLELRPHQLPDVQPPETLVPVAGRLIQRLGYLPGANKLRQIGHRDLAAAVLKVGGSRAYCRQHRLPYRDGRSSAARR